MHHIRSSAQQPHFVTGDVHGGMQLVLLAVMVCLSMPVLAQTANFRSRIASGGNHTLAVMSNGTLKSWGSNVHGSLGLGNTNSQVSAQPVAGITDVIAVDGGGSTTLVLFANGTVRSCGYNMEGQLGQGATWPWSLTLGPVVGLSTVVAISAGGGHSLALLANGMVKAWGYNQSGQVGIGSSTNQVTPQLIPGLTDVVAVSAGGSHSLALLSNGTVKAWGYNVGGQLGIGNTANQSTPQIVPGLTDVVAVSAGGGHSLALLSNGLVMAWGANTSGQLGIGNVLNQTAPQLVPGLVGVVDCAAGGEHSLATLASGGVRVWGLGTSGQLGLGSFTTNATPQVVAGLAGSTTVGVVAGDSHSLGLLSNGTLMAWGDNTWGQLGLGNGTSQISPQPVLSVNWSFLSCIGTQTQAIGSSMQWSVDGYPSVNASGMLYMFDVSLTGSTPGIAIPGVGTIPLNPPLLAINYGSLLAPWMSNFVGLLDANGHAAPMLIVPHHAALINLGVTGAALTINPTSASQIGHISRAMGTQLVAPVAQVQAVIPASGLTSGGEVITVIGGGFVSGAAVSIGSVAATNVAVLDQWTITCTAPSHVAGTGSVVVTNPGAAAGTWSGQFTWLAPLINSVTPNAGSMQGGTVLSISGANFHPNAAVMIGYTTSTAVTFVNSGLITCTVPPHIAGTPTTVWVSVTNPGGVSAFAPAAFTYN